MAIAKYWGARLERLLPVVFGDPTGYTLSYELQFDPGDILAAYPDVAAFSPTLVPYAEGSLAISEAVAASYNYDEATLHGINAGGIDSQWVTVGGWLGRDIPVVQADYWPAVVGDTLPFPWDVSLGNGVYKWVNTSWFQYFVGGGYTPGPLTGPLVNAATYGAYLQWMWFLALPVFTGRRRQMTKVYAF